MAVDTSQFRNGLKIELDGEPFSIVYFQHVKPGKGGAFVRTKVRNLKNGKVLERRFRAGERVELAQRRVEAVELGGADLLGEIEAAAAGRSGERREAGAQELPAREPRAQRRARGDPGRR